MKKFRVATVTGAVGEFESMKEVMATLDVVDGVAIDSSYNVVYSKGLTDKEKYAMAVDTEMKYILEGKSPFGLDVDEDSHTVTRVHRSDNRFSIIRSRKQGTQDNLFELFVELNKPEFSVRRRNQKGEAFVDITNQYTYSECLQLVISYLKNYNR